MSDSFQDPRTAWQSQPTQAVKISVAELRHKSQRLQSAVRWRNLREDVGAAFVAAAFGYYFWKFHTPLVRLGSALSVVAALVVMYQLHKRGSAAHVPQQMMLSPCLDFFRKELERQRDLLRGVFWWALLPFIPGLAVFLLGLAREQVAGRALPVAAVATICAIMFAAVAWLNQWAAGKLQRQIDALNALEKES